MVFSGSSSSSSNGENVNDPGREVDRTKGDGEGEGGIDELGVLFSFPFPFPLRNVRPGWALSPNAGASEARRDHAGLVVDVGVVVVEGPGTVIGEDRDEDERGVTAERGGEAGGVGVCKFNFSAEFPSGISTLIFGGETRSGRSGSGWTNAIDSDSGSSSVGYGRESENVMRGSSGSGASMSMGLCVSVSSDVEVT